jgi:hypothetical protein
MVSHPEYSEDLAHFRLLQLVVGTVAPTVLGRTLIISYGSLAELQLAGFVGHVAWDVLGVSLGRPRGLELSMSIARIWRCSDHLHLHH